jgi:hypothetical protein
MTGENEEKAALVNQHEAGVSSSRASAEKMLSREAETYKESTKHDRDMT